MKKLLFILSILIVSISSIGQDVVGSRLIAKEALYVNGVWVDSIRVDTVNIQNDNRTLMTAGAIYKFVTNRMGGGVGSGTVTSVAQTFTGGLISVAGSPITVSGTLALTVAGTSGGIPYFSSTSTWASSGLLTANAIMIGGGAGAAPSTTTTGTGVLTALGINVGSAGAFVTFNGALGTPSSGTLTNATGLLASGITLTDNTTNDVSTSAHGFFPKLTSNTVYYVNNAGALTALALGASGDVLTSNGATSAPSFTTPAGGTTWNSISSPTGDQALTFDAGESSTWTNSNTAEDLFTINSSTVTTSSFLSLNRTGTANAAGNNIAEFISSGATATSSITNTGVLVSVTNTGTTSTNNALTLTASGATTNNAINVTAGRVLLPAGSSTVNSIVIGTTGLYELAGLGGLSMYETGTTRLILSGQYGLYFRDAATFAFDVGNSSSLGSTNRFRITAPAVGTFQLGMESTQQSMTFKGANNAGTDAAGFNMTYQPGAGTGASTSAGTLIFSTPDATASGTTVQTYTTKFTVGRFGGVWASRNSQAQGADVASAAGAIALGTGGNVFEITGTDAITLISNVNWQNGSEVTLVFTSTASLTDGVANSGTDIGFELAGGANFTASADDTVTLVLSEMGGTQRWREKCRSVN